VSEELSFFDDPAISETPEPAPSEAPATPASEAAPAATPSVTPEQFQEMQRRLEASEKWKQDMGRMLLGQPGQPQPADPQAALTELLQDPIKYRQQGVQEAVQLARQEMEQQAIINDRRAKHPELSKLEGLIDWGSAMTQAAQQFQSKNGRPPSFAEALDSSIELVKGNLQGLLRNSQAQQTGDAARKLALNLDLSGGQPSGQGVDPMKLSDSEWVKYRDAVVQKASGY
jgi:hypothetical protein